MNKISVGVIFGCPSVEHEISIISAVQGMLSLDQNKYNIVPIYVSKKGHWYTGDALMNIENFSNIDSLLKTCTEVNFPTIADKHELIIPAKGLFAKPQTIAIDVILPITHGANGEDGCLQGLLEFINIPYAGPSVLGATTGMDKVMMKAILAAAGIPQVGYIDFTADRYFDDKEVVLADIQAKLGFPVIVKPANLGSSVGISKASDMDELLNSIDEAAGFASRIVVEKCVTDLREINCSVLGLGSEARASMCEEVGTSNGFLTYQDKYASGSKTKGMSGSKREIPAKLDEAVTAKIQDLALKTFSALDGAGVARIDFLLDNATNEVFVNEINTIPGSLSFYLWEPTGLKYSALLDEMINIALTRHRIKNNLTISYDTNILSNAAGMKMGKKMGAKS